MKVGVLESFDLVIASFSFLLIFPSYRCHLLKIPLVSDHQPIFLFLSVHLSSLTRSSFRRRRTLLRSSLKKTGYIIFFSPILLGLAWFHFRRHR